MNKRIGMLLQLVILMILAGCGPEVETAGVFHGMTVKEKIEVETKTHITYSEYYIVFEKDGREVELKVPQKDMYRALKEGSVVTVTYDEKYAIISIDFEGFEESEESLEIEDCVERCGEV